MQTKKTELRKRILEISRDTFFQKGFKCSNLRDIASG